MNAQDVTPPQVSYKTPSNATTGVVLNQTYFYVEFNEDVKYTSGQWRIVKTSTDEVVKTATPTGSSSFRTWQHVYFPNGLLEPNTGYHVEIDAGTYQDEAGNDFAGYVDNTGWTFTTEIEETDLPLISSLSPLDNSTDVSVSRTYFNINFNEQVTPVSGDWRMKKSSTDEVVKTGSVSPRDHYSGSWSISFGNDLLEPSTEYYIEVDAGTYKDVFDNEFAGIDLKTTWSFTTQVADSDAPKVSSLSPSHSTTEVLITKYDFAISFDEEVTYVSGDWRLVETATGNVVKTTTPSTSSSYSSWQNVNFSSELMEPGTTYHIEVDSDSYQDVFGNKFVGITAGNWSFTTQEAEADPPIAVSYNPDHGSSGIAITQQYFSLSFNEPVKTISGEWRLVKTSTGETIKSESLGEDTHFGYTKAVNFTSGLLEPSTQYHIEINAGTFEDLFKNPFGGIDDESVWSFTTEDPETDAPEIAGLNPSNNQTDVEITRVYFSISFNESVIASSGQWKLVKTSTSEVIKTINISASDNFDSNWGVNFASGLLEPSTEYHIEIDSDTYRDVFGNAFVGISDETTWSFITQEADSDPPLASYLSPRHQSTGVPITRNNFSINFNEDIQRSAGEWRLVKTATDEIVKTQTFNANDHFRNWHSVYFNNDLLEPSTEYHFEMDAGIYQDVFGNDFGAITDESRWSFTTQSAESNPPEITTFNLANNSVDVSIGQTYFAINFNEPVTYTSGFAYLVNSTTGEIIKTATPISNGYDHWRSFYFSNDLMEPGTKYHILVDQGAFEDVFGNEFAGITDETVWTFTTQEEEFDAPRISRLTPSNGSNNIDISATYFYLNFDEEVKYIKGEWLLVKSATGDVVKTFRPWTSSSYNDYFGISFSDELLEPSTDYHIEIEQGAYEDIWGNQFDGINSDEVWSFTTQAAETDAPTLQAITPEHNATDQDLTGLVFTLDFNERVRFSEGQIYLVETSTDRILKTLVPLTSGFSSSQSFDFVDSPLEPNTQYHLEIDRGTYVDLFGNEFAGISDASEWSFTTRASETDAPVVEQLFPANNSTDVSIDRTYFTIDFNEMVKYEGGVLKLIKTSTDEVIKYVNPQHSGNYNELVEFDFPEGLLEPSTQYHLELDGEVLSDFFDNYFSGMADENTWSFTTEASETEAPEIISFSPSNDATNISTYTSYFYLNFDEPVTLNDGEIRLVNSASGEIIGRVITYENEDYDFSKSIYFRNLRLESFTTYHFEIEAGTYVDVFGNPYAGINDKTSWNFETRDNNAPVFSSSSLVYAQENSMSTGFSAVATDNNGVTYGFSSNGEDDQLFKIDATTGAIDFLSVPDYESPHDANADNGYLVEVTARDNRGNTTIMTVAIVVQDQDEITPVLSSKLELSFKENSQTVAYLPSVIDDSKVSFSLSAAGKDSDLFEIKTTTGEVSFKVSPDFEAPTDSNTDNIYEVGLNITDEVGNHVGVMVKITVTDVDENAPRFTSATSTTFTENATGLVYKAIATDENSITYKLSGQGVDDGLFTMAAESGELYFIASPNFEIPTDFDKDNSYSVEIMATDNLGNHSKHNVTITVGNVIESLTFISSASVSVAENITNVYSAIATADGNITYAINAQGADDDLFGIDAATGAVTFKSAPDYENPHDNDKNNVYELSLIARDGDGNSVTLTVNIAITDIDENIPVFVSDASVTVVENVTGAVYQAVATDQSAITYALSGEGSDNALFEISGNTGKVNFKTSPDYESPQDADLNNQYEITVAATDGDGLSATQLITISVTDFDEANPIFISEANVDFLENKVGVAYQAIATDENEVSYGLTGMGVDESLFTIETKTGKVSFIDAPDYEAPVDKNLDNVYEIEIKAIDALGYTASFSVSISVIGENDNAPTAERVDFIGELNVGEILIGAYEFYDLDGNEEKGSTVQWYRSADGSLDDLSPIENANELTYRTTEQDEFSYLVLKVIPNDGLLQGSGYFSGSKYISSRVLDVDPNLSSTKIMDLGTGAVRLKFASQANREILIYSLEGKVERTVSTKEDTLDIEYLKPGVWAMKYAEQNGISETLKFIVD